MKRLALYLAVALLAGWPNPARGQAPPAPPEPPAPPAGTPAPAPDPNVRRHRMGDANKTYIDTDAQFQAALQAHIDLLRRRVDELEAKLEHGGDPAAQAELEKLHQELEELDSLKPLELPDVVVLDPDQPGQVLWNRDGSGAVIVDPDGKVVLKSRGEKVAYFRHLYIGHDDWIDGPAVAILGNVHVLGHVEEDVVSVGGNVYVEGTVGGNVVAPFGDVFVGGDAYIEGDVVALSVSAEDQAAIGGTIEEVPLFRLPWVNGGPHALLMLASTAAVSKIVFSLLFGLLTLAVAPRHVARVMERLRQRPAGSFFGGVLIQILILPVFVLLLVTVIGIPLAFLALPLLIVAALLLGFVACSRIVGESLLKGESARPATVLFLTGALVLCAPLALASLLALSGIELGDSLFLVVNLLFFVGLCLMYFVYTAGLGAAIFSRLGTRGPAPVRSTAPPGGGPFGAEPTRSALPQAPPAAEPT